LVVDIATNRDHCMTHRPLLHMYLNCSLSGTIFTHIYFSIFKKGIVETVLGIKAVCAVYTQGTCLIHFVLCVSRKFAASLRTTAMEMLALIILFRQV